MDPFSTLLFNNTEHLSQNNQARERDLKKIQNGKNGS